MSEEDDANGLSEASGGVSGERGPREGESVERDSRRWRGVPRVYGVSGGGRWRRARAAGRESGGYELG